MSQATTARVAPTKVTRQALPTPAEIDTALRMIRYARPCRGRSDDPTLPGLTAAQKAVACEVALHCLIPGGTGWCFAHTTRLSLLTGLCESAVEKALATMVSKGWLAAKLDHVPSGRGFKVTHYRVTPVATDIMDDAEIEQHVDAYRAGGAAKKAAQRGTLPRMSPYQVRDVPVPGEGTKANVPVPGTVDPDLIRTGGDKRQQVTSCPVDDAARTHDDRATVAAVVALSPVTPTLSIAGVPLPADMTHAHGSYERAIIAMVDAKLPHLSASGRGFAWSMLASAHHTGLVQIAAAIYAVWARHGGHATVQHMTTALCQPPRMRDHKQRQYAVRWLERLGAYSAALIDAEDMPVAT